MLAHAVLESRGSDTPHFFCNSLFNPACNSRNPRVLIFFNHLEAHSHKYANGLANRVRWGLPPHIISLNFTDISCRVEKLACLTQFLYQLRSSGRVTPGLMSQDCWFGTAALVKLMLSFGIGNDIAFKWFIYFDTLSPPDFFYGDVYFLNVMIIF